MSFYPAKGGNSGKNLRVFWGGINIRSDHYNGKMPTDTDFNILYEFEGQNKDAFPWVGGSSYVVARIYPISKKAKAIKRIRIRGFHTGQTETGASLKGTNCTVTEVKRNETGFDRIFDLTGLSGDFYKITLVGSNTNQITGFEIIEAE